MKIKEFSVSGFRNIGHVSISDMANINQFVGRNGHGKTNLLEAIYFWLTGVSFRGASVGEMMGEGQASFEIGGLIEQDNGLVSKVVMRVEGVGLNATKTLLVDDQKISRSQLKQHFPVVVFSPEEVDLVRATAQARRKLVDLVCALMVPEYKNMLLDYLRIWRNRNQLLLAIKQRRAAEDELDVWDEQMARVGMEILKIRKDAVARLQEMVQRSYRLFAPTLGNLKLKYSPNLDVFSESEYREHLRAVRQLDIVRTHTTKGIHRDDMIILEGGQRAVDRSSRGEFRSIVLALKLAYGELAKELWQESPVYLLDDVMSELDEGRRRALMANLEGLQVVITSHEALGADKLWVVTEGQVAEAVVA